MLATNGIRYGRPDDEPSTDDTEVIKDAGGGK